MNDHINAVQLGLLIPFTMISYPYNCTTSTAPPVMPLGATRYRHTPGILPLWLTCQLPNGHPCSLFADQTAVLPTFAEGKSCRHRWLGVPFATRIRCGAGCCCMTRNTACQYDSARITGTLNINIAVPEKILYLLFAGEISYAWLPFTYYICDLYFFNVPSFINGLWFQEAGKIHHLFSFSETEKQPIHEIACTAFHKNRYNITILEVMVRKCFVYRIIEKDECMGLLTGLE